MFCAISFSSQLDAGQKYDELKPVISIWVIPSKFLPTSPAFHHHFQLYDTQRRVVLTEHLSLHTLELAKWDKRHVEIPLDRWVKFFLEGKNLDDDHLPDYMQTDEMRQAMSVLRMFSEKERNYHQYQARVNYWREKACIEEERDLAKQKLDLATQELDLAKQKLDSAQQKRDSAQQERDLAQQREKATLAELARMRRVLQNAGLNSAPEVVAEE